uniref:Putative site-specific DNA endonuclease n=1 Tax=Chaetophora lobata TaxID=1249516 RepID=A0A7U1G3D2_9CHLO|nr:putative site-specific DNA endonuclease [Chaetophora lobata]
MTRKFLNLLNPVGLAVWWCDDGSIVGDGQQGVLCMDNISKSEAEICKDYFHDVWNIDCSVAKVKSKKTPNKYYYRLYFSGENCRKIVELVTPFIPIKSMIYKTFLRYNDFELDLRWRSFLIKNYVPRFFNSARELEIFIKEHKDNRPKRLR